MENFILNVAAAPLSWNGGGFETKSKACVTLGEISIERANDIKSKEEDGMIV